MGQDVYIISKFLPTNYQLEKKRKCNFPAEKSGGHHLKQIIKVYITRNGADHYHVLLDMVLWEGPLAHYFCPRSVCSPE